MFDCTSHVVIIWHVGHNYMYVRVESSVVAIEYCSLRCTVRDHQAIEAPVHSLPSWIRVSSRNTRLDTCYMYLQVLPRTDSIVQQKQRGQDEVVGIRCLLPLLSDGKCALVPVREVREGRGGLWGASMSPPFVYLFVFLCSCSRAYVHTKPPYSPEVSKYMYVYQICAYVCSKLRDWNCVIKLLQSSMISWTVFFFQIHVTCVSSVYNIHTLSHFS